MERPKALIIVTPGFPEDELDSTCLPARQAFVAALKRIAPNLNVIVLSLRYPFFSGTYQWKGTTVITFGSKNKHKIFRLYAYFRILRTMRRLKKEFDVIGLLSFWLDKSAFIAARFAKRNQLPHFCWLLGQDAKEGNKYVKLIKPKGEFLIALSDFIAREFNKNYNITPTNVIPVGIDASMFSNREWHRTIDMLGVGSLISLKQYDVFLKVIRQLVCFFPNINAVICGDGVEMENLVKLRKKLGLVSRVLFTGELPHSEVLMLMQKSKLLVHTSNYEGFGTVNLEALYAGAKVLSFVKPMNEPIENWFHVSDVDEMVDVIKTILLEPNPTYKKLLPYSIEKVASAVLNLYHYKVDEIS